MSIEDTSCWAPFGTLETQDIGGNLIAEKSITLLPRVLIVNLLTYGQISIGDRKSCQGKWLKSGQMQVAFRNRKNPGFLKVRHRGNLSSEPQKDKTPFSFQEMGLGVQGVGGLCAFGALACLWQVQISRGLTSQPEADKSSRPDQER